MLDLVKTHKYDVILVDMSIERPKDGLEWIPILKEFQPEATLIALSGGTEFQTVRKAFHTGVTDYVSKDAAVIELPAIIDRIREQRALKKSAESAQREIRHQSSRFEIIGDSQALRNIQTQIEKFLHSPAPVLITGERGTGKELIARALRAKDHRGHLVPFVALDAATLQPSIAESLLFGYEKGAFTGADKDRAGLFESADGGILYIDEIGNLSLEVQNKLLRVLQEKEVLRLGATVPVSLQFRLISATNQDLEALVREGKFKADLLERINTLEIKNPPLRERKSDLYKLIAHFSQKHFGRTDALQFTPDAWEILNLYPFPGNIRELENTLISVHTLYSDGHPTCTICAAQLPDRIRATSARQALQIPGSTGESPLGPDTDGLSFYEKIARAEKELLAREFALSDGNISQLALRLKMDRSHLSTKLKAHGINSKKSA